MSSPNKTEELFNELINLYAEEKKIADEKLVELRKKMEPNYYTKVLSYNKNYFSNELRSIFTSQLEIATKIYIEISQLVINSNDIKEKYIKVLNTVYKYMGDFERLINNLNVFEENN
jgi:hypothetical protein